MGLWDGCDGDVEEEGDEVRVRRSAPMCSIRVA